MVITPILYKQKDSLNSICCGRGHWKKIQQKCTPEQREFHYSFGLVYPVFDMPSTCSKASDMSCVPNPCLYIICTSCCVWIAPELELLLDVCVWSNVGNQVDPSELCCSQKCWKLFSYSNVQSVSPQLGWVICFWLRFNMFHRTVTICLQTGFSLSLWQGTV
jgi:hypothetical protein